MTAAQRRFPIGAEFVAAGSVHFRVWAPGRERVEVRLDHNRTLLLELEDGGYFSGLAENVPPGTLYHLELDGNSTLYPDPASRFQPTGPHGPSQVVDPGHFPWTDQSWPGVQLHGQSIYEIHVGTFTKAGTWDGARERLPDLAELGITLIEVMPIAEFPGNFGWGYDGVDLFAPSHLYGSPDDFREFVNEAHRLGLGVILDVVYNHFGPDGNYLKEFSPNYFSKRYETDWGEAVNFDGADCQPVREFVVSNARYWISEFHLDGLRLDATQQIFDASREHIVAEVTRNARTAAEHRSVLIIGENEPQDSRFLRSPYMGGFGLDALWNDDFHHTARVAATGRRGAYYSDYRGTPQEFISALKWGFLYQGQYYAWQKQQRGAPALDIPAPAFVLYLQNHDQVANSAGGERIHRLTGMGTYRALTGLLLLAPGTPMLFQGQEFAASSPFLYFADHKTELAELVEKGRLDFLSQFPSIAYTSADSKLAAPHDESTFARSKLDHSEKDRNQHILLLHQDLLRLRREDTVFSQQRTDWMHGSVLEPSTLALRFFGKGGSDRLLVMNLGNDLRLDSIADPLIAPPKDHRWELLWSSESSRYGGCAAPPVDEMNRWYLYSQCTAVLKSVQRT